MCNLYSMTTSQAAIRDLGEAMGDATGNLPPLPGIFPATTAPAVRNDVDGRELVLMRSGMPSPAFALRNRKTDGRPPRAKPRWRTRS
ncbi:MAG: hypothetical protein AAF311_12100 [Pseudomonadota bacterium]